jgi:hypothetical protein
MAVGTVEQRCREENGFFLASEQRQNRWPCPGWIHDKNCFDVATGSQRSNSVDWVGIQISGGAFRTSEDRIVNCFDVNGPPQSRKGWVIAFPLGADADETDLNHESQPGETRCERLDHFQGFCAGAGTLKGHCFTEWPSCRILKTSSKSVSETRICVPGTHHSVWSASFVESRQARHAG